MFRFGHCPTLTSSSRHLWAYSLAEPKYDRWVTVREMAMLQGFDPDLVDHLKPTRAARQLGNAMSMPAVGLAIAHVLGDYARPAGCSA